MPSERWQALYQRAAALALESCLDSVQRKEESWVRITEKINVENGVTMMTHSSLYR